MIAKPDIKDLTIGQLGEWLTRKGIAAYRAGQILRWIYKRQADGFDEMSDLSKNLRETLDGCFTIDRLQKVQVDISEDGSRKFLFGQR